MSCSSLQQACPDTNRPDLFYVPRLVSIVEDELVLVAVKSNRWPRTIFRPKAVALMKRGAINELSVLSTLQDVPRIVQRRGPSMISVDRVTTVLE